jgi:hypothetical protein
MPEEFTKAVDADMSDLQTHDIMASTEHERAMKLVAHMFLRLWTRFAIETGQRLSMSPSQYSMGNYEGKMRWMLNEAVDFRSLDRIELGGNYGRAHALIGEMFSHKGEDRVRVVFALEEEQVRGSAVFVNYLVYDSTLVDFRIEKAFHALKPALASWSGTVLRKDDAPLWDFCKDKLECVGA